MAETENETTPQNEAEKQRGKFNVLVFLACLLSAGSLIWTTYSLLDFFQVGGIDLTHMSLREINPVGLSAAGTADIAWSLTMIAEYRGVQILVSGRKGNKSKKYNLLPWIGWAEVLFVTFLLVKHGHAMGNGAAAFAGVLPILTKLSWTMALADLKDPEAPTDDEKAQIAEKRRRANVKFEEIKATEREHQAELEEKRRENAAKLEDKRAEAERKKLEQQTEFELEEDRLRGENRLKALRARMVAEFQIEGVRNRQEIAALQDEFDWEQGLRRPRPRTIVGQTVPQRSLPQGSALEITDGERPDEGWSSLRDELAALGLPVSEQRKAERAHSYYTVDAQNGGAVTKAAFVKANRSVDPTLSAPRLSEATTDYPVEWFVQNGLATWMTTGG